MKQESAMASLSEYFRRNREPAEFEFGARVFGRYNKIPFVGTVGFDGVVSPDLGPRVTVTLDLPIIVNGTYTTVLAVERKILKLLKEF